jgi:hypothetical protein
MGAGFYRQIPVIGFASTAGFGANEFRFPVVAAMEAMVGVEDFLRGGRRRHIYMFYPIAA